MDDNIYKIALAAFFHDIGKFAERASASIVEKSAELKPAFYKDEKFLNDNMDLYHMKQREIITIDIGTLYSDTAKLSEIDSYFQKSRALAGEGNDIVLTGVGPVWLYLKIAHALHGKARRLIYRSPVTGDVVIFDHSPE